MMSTNKQNYQDYKRVRAENERKRRLKIKADPLRYAELKEKERLRYIKRKENKIVKTIDEMTPSEQLAQRRRWRNNQRNYRKSKDQLKKFEEENSVEIKEIEPENNEEFVIKNEEGLVDIFENVRNDVEESIHKQNEHLDVDNNVIRINELLNIAEENTIAKSWAFKLAKMKFEQRIWAEKFISDILTEGELGTLHRYSVRIND